VEGTLLYIDCVELTTMVFAFFCDNPCGSNSGEYLSYKKPLKQQQSKIAECDYDRNCTPLFKRLEAKDWDSIRAFLDIGAWPYHFTKDPATPAEQARTWVTRMHQSNCGSGNNKAIKWSQLPLHLALVLGAPFSVIRRLVALYPPSVQCTNDEQLLPLHLALRHGAPDETVELLLQAFPSALHARGQGHRTALKYAVRSSKQARLKIMAAFIEQSLQAKPQSEADGKEKKEPTEPLEETRNDQEDDNNSLNDIQSSPATAKTILAEKSDADLAVLLENMIALEEERNAVEHELEKKDHELASARHELQVKLHEIQDAYKSVELAALLPKGQHNTTTSKRIIGPAESMEKERICILQASKNELETCEKRLRADINVLQADLESLENCIGLFLELEDLDQLNVQVTRLQARCLHHAQTRTRAEITEVKQMLKQSLRQDVAPNEDDVGVMQGILDGLETTDFEKQTSEELCEMTSELVPLKKVLQKKRDAAKARKELLILRRLLEYEVQWAATSMEPSDVEAVSATISLLDPPKFDEDTLEELLDKMETAKAVKTSIQCKECTKQTFRDLVDLETLLNAKLKKADNDTMKSVLMNMKGEVEALSNSAGSTASRDVLDTKMRVTSMREELKQMEVAARLKVDLRALRIDLKMQLQNAMAQDTKNMEEIKNIQAAILLLDTKYIDKADAVELDGLRKDVEFTLEYTQGQAAPKKPQKKHLFRFLFREKMAKKGSKTHSSTPGSISSESKRETTILCPPKGFRNVKSGIESFESESEAEQPARPCATKIAAGAQGDGSGHPSRYKNRGTPTKNVNSVPTVIEAAPATQ